MDYQWYQSDIDEVWKYKLLSSFNKINREIYNKIAKRLEIPNFAINSKLNNRWGEWRKNSRTIVFSIKLLKNFEWLAVEHVMRHEIAHQIVDEVFCMPANPHGQLWEKACLIVNIDPNRCSSSIFLGQFKSAAPSPLIEKVQKLIIHGNDKAVTQDESELFIAKAYSLMTKHNISLKDIQGVGEQVYISRPVGPLVSSHRSWLGEVACLVSKYYSVKTIWTHCGAKKRIEFFGEPGNLDVAEYVFHALLNQSEILWNNYKREHQEKIKTDIDYRSQFSGWDGRIRKKISKTAFMRGLLFSYEQKLSKTKKDVIENISAMDKAIILSNDGSLKESFKRQYNPRNLGRAVSSYGNGWDRGFSEGKNLVLAKGVSSGDGGVKLLK